MTHESSPPPAERPVFTPVLVRTRHDGWTAERQTDFIGALAESGCVDEACRRVGMSPSSAYALRRRRDAASFRQAWDIALDYAIRRLSDAAFSRALHGVSRPVFYQGEQIGERRHYDERLTMFLLRYRDPARYGAWLDRQEAAEEPDGVAHTLARSLVQVDRDAFAMDQLIARICADEDAAEDDDGEAAAEDRDDLADDEADTDEDDSGTDVA